MNNPSSGSPSDVALSNAPPTAPPPTAPIAPNNVPARIPKSEARLTAELSRTQVVGLGRFELPTSGLGNLRSIHLSYSPTSRHSTPKNSTSEPTVSPIHRPPPFDSHFHACFRSARVSLRV